MARFFSDLTRDLRTRPGVTAAGATSFLPLDPGWRLAFGVRGRDPFPPGQEPDVQYVTVTEGLFEALGVALLRGRLLQDSDDAQAPGAVVINETMARRFWGRDDPLGDRIISVTGGIGPLGRALRDSREYEAAAGAVVLATAVLACGAPARRATRIDPVVALRVE